MVSFPFLVAASGPHEFNVSPVADRFPKNKQNESPMAVNPLDPMNAVSGANDEINEPDCTTTSSGSSSCPFSPTVDITGVYWTKDGGATWHQTILKWFDKFGFTSDGDPAVAFGPQPGPDGSFNWANGARAYFASLVGSPSFGPGEELLAVAHSDDGGQTWSDPVIATTRQNPVDFNDKVSVWADPNPSSPFFGNVYVGWTLFIGNPFGVFGNSNTFSPEPIMVARSTDGGQTFGSPVQLTQAANNGAVGGRQDSFIRTGPEGAVYVFWDGAASHQNAILGARSDDGGGSYGRPFVVSFISPVPNPFPGASFRVFTFPTADVSHSDGRIFIAWADYDFAKGHGVVKMATSSDRGNTWNVGTIADVTGRSAFNPAVAVKPDGTKVFVGFNAIDDVKAGTPPSAGVVFYDAYSVVSTNGGTFGSPVKISAKSSDPDASTTNGLRSQFLGDYNGAAASNGAAWFSWTDSRNGQPCAAVDGWRASGFTTTKPNIYDSCPSDFGNTDIFVVMVPW